MPTVLLGINESGKLDGITERFRRGYAKWRKLLSEMGPRDSVEFTFKVPRSGPYHRRFFSIVNRLFDMQEQFDDDEQFLQWLKVGAGYCDFVPGPKGKMVALPKSISWASLDQAEFEPIAESIFAFMRTRHFSQFLWPETISDVSMQVVGDTLAEFD